MIYTLFDSMDKLFHDGFCGYEEVFVTGMSLHMRDKGMFWLGFVYNSQDGCDSLKSFGSSRVFCNEDRHGSWK